MSTVEVRGIAKSFGPVRVLEGIDLSVAQGELVALLGPSGCGKSTLIRIIAGLERPDRGEVRLGDRIVEAPGVHLPPEARGIGMVFQSYAVWPHRNVRDNVAYPLKLRKRSAPEIAQEVERILALIHLDGLGDRFPHQLSGGQQQRVALARALIGAPEVLLLDEPLSNLDARLRHEMRAELAALKHRLGVTLILVTHDQAEALSTADRVAVMRDGRIVQCGPPEELYRSPVDLYVARTVGAVNAIPVQSVRPENGRFNVEAGPIRCNVARAEGERSFLMVRPENVALDPSGDLELEVRARAFLGDRIELALGAAELVLRAIAPASAAPEIGARVRVRLIDPVLLS